MEETMQERGLKCDQLVVDADIVEGGEPAEHMIEAHWSDQADTGVVLAPPTRTPLTKVTRPVICSQLAASREESSLALVELRNPDS